MLAAAALVWCSACVSGALPEAAGDGVGSDTARDLSERDVGPADAREAVDSDTSGDARETEGDADGSEGSIADAGDARDEAGPTCEDGVQNGREQGIDCGGPDCPPCPSYSWRTGPWSDCQRSSCTRSRDVFCERDDGTEVEDAKCSSPKPDSEETCSITTSPSVSGSWSARCPQGPYGGSCNSIGSIRTNGSTITIEGTGSTNPAVGTLQLTDATASGSFSVNCTPRGGCDDVEAVTTSGTEMIVEAEGGFNTGTIDFTGATLSGEFRQICAPRTGCDSVDSVTASGNTITITSSAGTSGTVTLAGVQVCP